MTTISEIDPLIPSPPPKERPVWMERQWVAIDGLGTVRNSLFTTSVFLRSASKAAGVISKIIPGFQILGGLLISYNAARHNLPNMWKELKEVDPADREGKRIARLGLADQICYGSFGPLFVVAGSTGIASLATSGAVSSSLMQAAEISAGGILGAVCVARGLIIMARSGINLSYLIPFHNNFRQAVKSKQALEFLKTESTDFAALERRMGSDAAKKVKAYIDAAKKVKASIDDPASITIEELIRTVDKGIFEQKCKQWLKMSIAFLMLIGGIASLVFSGGITGLAVAAIIGISFSLMEAEWVVFDKSTWFTALVDKLYTPLEIPPQTQTPPQIESISA